MDAIVSPQQSQTAAATAAAPSQADEASSLITADFQAFLQLLTTQMENQDPLNPLSSDELATQLATFSGVEQQVRTNQLLEDLATGFQLSSIGDLAGWIGLDARAAMPVYYDGAPVTFSLDPPSFADQVQLVVTDENGFEVRRIQVPVSDEPMQFLGQDGNGTDLPAGVYTLSMEAYAGGELIETQPAEVYGRVLEAFQRGNETFVTLPGGVQVRATDVLGVRAPIAGG
ncbi:MAG: flagellar hook capping FlgD N-terminal domain-containing protein [Pseudomonadota bacterium]